MTAYLVNGSLVNVGINEYAYSELQEWFEPNISKAAEAMRTCAYVRKSSGEKIRAALYLVKKEYSFDAVAERYERRI